MTYKLKIGDWITAPGYKEQPLRIFGFRPGCNLVFFTVTNNVKISKWTIGLLKNNNLNQMKLDFTQVNDEENMAHAQIDSVGLFGKAVNCYHCKFYNPCNNKHYLCSKCRHINLLKKCGDIIGL